MFCVYYANLSGERLQDHWSAGLFSRIITLTDWLLWQLVVPIDLQLEKVKFCNYSCHFGDIFKLLYNNLVI